MIARAAQCRPQLLREAVANHLSSAEYEDLSTHLDTCEHCRSELEQLAGGAQWSSRVQECLSSSIAIALDDSVAIDEEDESRDDDWQGLLEPSDDPAKLGRLGKYEIELLVGRGGFGIVFKAFDPELNRTVAIKVLSTPASASAAARKRFSREARSAAAVVHDHVVPIYEVNTKEKLPFLVMPFLSGRSLQERLDVDGMLGVEEVLRIAMQSARGLAAAHAQGTIHRDIKPANILLENGVERVRISDFGLARAVDDATQTQSGFIAGTPAYMAPEQARGEPLDARADLFSLGSVMYAMCAGHPPFRAETTLAVLRRICDDEPRDLREHNPSVPDWLCEIIGRLLSKSPSDRFQSADEVAELLGQWLAHVQQPALVPAPKRAGGQTSKRAGERGTSVPRWLAVAAAALVLIACSVWFGPSLWRQSQNQPRPSANRSAQTSARVEAIAIQPSLWPGLKPDQIQPELNLAWEETLQVEARLPAASATRYESFHDVLLLDWQLRSLEQELESEIAVTIESN